MRLRQRRARGPNGTEIGLRRFHIPKAFSSTSVIVVDHFTQPQNRLFTDGRASPTSSYEIVLIERDQKGLLLTCIHSRVWLLSDIFVPTP